MDAVKVGDIYNLKQNGEFMAGKYLNKAAAQYAADNLNAEQLETLWIYVQVNQGKSAIEKADVDFFIVVV